MSQEGALRETLAAVAARDAPERTRALVAALRSPSCFAHPVGDVMVMQTHISYVILAGDFAYKIKKPVRLAFLDFAELEARHFYCDEELRLNRRTARDLYLDVVPITGTVEAPVVGGAGPAIEFAVRMRRFAQDDLLDHLARAGRLQPEMVDALGTAVARFHAAAISARPETEFGSPALVLAQALDNLAALERIERYDGVRHAAGELVTWTRLQHAALAPAFAERSRDGFVRECHGDLHLGNVVIRDGVPVPFDCIEFDARLRCIDVMSDVAFAMMDLTYLGHPRFAARFLNAYLERTGDYGGLRVLRFYAVYRAAVRAKIAGIRAHQVDLEDRERPGAVAAIHRHLDLARHLAHRKGAALILMHGLSGSGKTTVAAELLEFLGAIRLRSDVERRRLHGLEPLARSASPVGGGIYGSGDMEGTYGRLALLAREALDDGYPVIVDATFLKRAQRDAFRALAGSVGVPFTILACEAPEAQLRERLALRNRARTDPSEADAAVLALQMAEREPLGAEEAAQAVILDTTREGWAQAATDALLRRL